MAERLVDADMLRVLELNLRGVKSKQIVHCAAHR